MGSYPEPGLRRFLDTLFWVSTPPSRFALALAFVSLMRFPLAPRGNPIEDSHMTPVPDLGAHEPEEVNFGSFTGRVRLHDHRRGRPAAIAAGVVAGWLSLMLAVSFRLRKWIGQRGWRRLHYASFAAFGLSVIRAVTAGTDLMGVRGLVVAAVAVAPVLWLGFARMLLPRHVPRSRAAAVVAS